MDEVIALVINVTSGERSAVFDEAQAERAEGVKVLERARIGHAHQSLGNDLCELRVNEIVVLSEHRLREEVMPFAKLLFLRAR